MSVPLLYNVASLLQEPVGAARDYPLDDEIVDPLAIDEAVRVQGTLHMIRTNRGLLVKAHLASEVSEECSRCLDSYQQPLTIEIEEEFLPNEDVTPAADVLDDQVYTIRPDHTLDLTEAVRQSMLLARPMKPLCREACAGLCPQCGANRNKVACNCPEEPQDTHWAKLKDLLK